MPTGTDAGLLENPRPQSVYKHAILEQYVIRFATMTASRLNPKRSVLFDGLRAVAASTLVKQDPPSTYARRSEGKGNHPDRPSLC